MLPNTKMQPHPTGTVPAGNSERMVSCVCGQQFFVPVNAVKITCPFCNRPVGGGAAVHQR